MESISLRIFEGTYHWMFIKCADIQLTLKGSKFLLLERYYKKYGPVEGSQCDQFWIEEKGRLGRFISFIVMILASF